MNLYRLSVGIKAPTERELRKDRALQPAAGAGVVAPSTALYRSGWGMGVLVFSALVVLLVWQVLRSVRPPAFSAEEKAPMVSAAFGGNCEKLLLKEIDKGRSEILVAIYTMTRRNIGKALVHAAERGAKVRVKYDAKSAEQEGMKQLMSYLVKRGVECTPVTLEKEYAIMHHKFTVIDRKRVLTGSYNYTTSASESNYENLVLIESPDTAESFAEEFEKIKDR